MNRLWYNYTMSAKKKQLDIIGATEHVTIGSYKNIPAKIDTGADSSSIWASHIQVDKDGALLFRLFDTKSPFYTGEDFKRTDYKVAVIRNSSGKEEIRYRTHLKVTIGGRTIKALFFLSDRSRNNFPILIGRRTISGKFYVDVSKNHTPIPSKNPKTKIIQRRLQENPYEFHQKYIKKLSGNPDNIKLKRKEQ